MPTMKRRRHRQTFTEKTGFPAKLLVPGYSGELTAEELKIIKTELQNRSKLRARWGFKDGERITNKKIQVKALEAVESDISIEELLGSENPKKSGAKG